MIVTASPAVRDVVDRVTPYLAAVPAVVVDVVKEALEPVKLELSRAVTVPEPAVAFVVYTTVATPFAFVVDVALAKEPAFDELHVTVLLAVLTALPFASSSCAVTVTAAPAVSEVADRVTPYFVAVPAAPAGTLTAAVRADPKMTTRAITRTKNRRAPTCIELFPVTLSPSLPNHQFQPALHSNGPNTIGHAPRTERREA